MGTTQAVRPDTCPPDHSSYSEPREVLSSPALPEREKRRILLDWLRDELALLVADDEGMFGVAPPRVDRVLRTLHELER